MSCECPEGWSPVPRYGRWLETLDVPIFRGFSIEDLRTMELGPGEEREWRKGSCFIPPNNWRRQHLNAGLTPARYMPLHTARHRLFGDRRGTVIGPNHQIECVDEDPMVRQSFEAELAKRGLRSLMPPECSTDPNFEFDDEGGDE